VVIEQTAWIVNECKSNMNLGNLTLEFYLGRDMEF